MDKPREASPAPRSSNDEQAIYQKRQIPSD
jgi:hypothetical protein